MPSFETPGVYVIEKPSASIIVPLSRSTFCVVGKAPVTGAYLNQLVPISNWTEFRSKFAPNGTPGLSTNYLYHAVQGFYMNSGGRCYILNIGDNASVVEGLRMLESNDEISIVNCAGFTDIQSHEALISHCEKMQDRVCILDLPNTDNSELLKTVEVAQAAARGPKPKDKDTAGASDKAPGGATGGATGSADKPADAGGLRPRVSPAGFATCYYPWLEVPDPVEAGKLVEVPPSGYMAGIWARVDATRGIHKAPANEVPRGALGLTNGVTPEEHGPLNSAGINVIRKFADQGLVVFGAVTLATRESEWHYLNVRRLFIMVEQSILRQTRWIVFEPNDRTLWKTVKSVATGFLTHVYHDGALMGRTPEEAFFVKCDEENNPQESIDMGILNVTIGMAPVKPAEFVVFTISQARPGAQMGSV